MAKAGAPSGVAVGSRRSAQTRQRLVDAAIETLKSDGYGRASARTIALRAGLSQGLIFYHFGSVAHLLLAALDAVSEERLQIYSAEVSNVTSVGELVQAAGRNRSGLPSRDDTAVHTQGVVLRQSISPVRSALGAKLVLARDQRDVSIAHERTVPQALGAQIADAVC